MKYSDYQKAIFRHVLTSKESMAVISRAGVGKTATILESFKYSKGKTVALAFNRHIAKELKEKNKTKAEISTFHSLGLRAISSKFGNIKVDNEKVAFILLKILDKKNYPMIADFKKAISIAKMSLQDSPDQIVTFLEEYDIDPLPFTSEEFAKIVIKALRLSKENTSVVDFDDMVWFPFIFDLPLGRYDNIFVDECQDLNYAQLNMVLKLKSSTSRVFMFLDDKQAIYSFRCAKINVVMDFIEKLNCIKLSLPMTYRCPKLVVDFVKKYVDDYIAFEENKDGEILQVDVSQFFYNLEPNCVILSRYNAPLIDLYFDLINNKIPANIKGKDIGDNIYSFIKKFKSKDFQKTKDKIKSKKISLINSKEFVKPEIIDQHDLAITLMNQCANFVELKKLISNIFLDVEDKNKVLLSTIHSFKGGEKDNVYVLENTLNHSDVQEEKNINYVAYTRTKNKLFLVK
jgi:DNA helicase-2/ATP-dependent DNA helicase PcrA